MSLRHTDDQLWAERQAEIRHRLLCAFGGLVWAIECAAAAQREAA